MVAEGRGLAPVDALACGCGVLVTTRVGAWVTSNCTSVGVEPRPRRTRGRSPAAPSQLAGAVVVGAAAAPDRRGRRSCCGAADHDLGVGIAVGQSWLDQIRSLPEAIFTTSVSGETLNVQAGWMPWSRSTISDRRPPQATRHRRQHADLVGLALTVGRQRGAPCGLGLAGPWTARRARRTCRRDGEALLSRRAVAARLDRGARGVRAGPAEQLADPEDQQQGDAAAPSLRRIQ